MRKLLTLLFTFSGLIIATQGHAANGVIDITWGGLCAPVVQNITPATTPATSLIASVLGNDQTHTGHQVVFLIGSANRDVPDAWRFDAAGCQGSSFLTMNHLAPASAVKTCPSFAGASTVLNIKEYGFVATGSIYDPDTMYGLIADAHPDGVTALPGTRYFLGQWLFDHSFSVAGPGTPGTDCGGFETPMCVALLTGNRHVVFEGGTSNYVAGGVEFPFDEGPNDWRSTHGLAGCPATPVQNRTWGHIKSQYRN